MRHFTKILALGLAMFPMNAFAAVQIYAGWTGPDPVSGYASNTAYFQLETTTNLTDVQFTGQVTDLSFDPTGLPPSELTVGNITAGPGFDYSYAFDGHHGPAFASDFGHTWSGATYTFTARDASNQLLSLVFNPSSGSNRQGFVGFLGNDPSGNESTQTVAYSLVATTTAVPEPASWALMISGFGIIGGSLRVRRGRKSATGVRASA